MNFVPVIAGGYVNAYSIARTFHETYGINSLICNYQSDFTSYSSFCECINVPDPRYCEQPLLAAMREIGLKLAHQGKKAILFVTGDEWLTIFSKHKHVLEDIFEFTFPDWNVVEQLTIKDKLYKLCDKLLIKYPKTCVCFTNNISDCKALKPPILIKPSSVTDFISAFSRGPRNQVFSSHEEVAQYIQKKFIEGYSSPFIVQEYIPGGIENLYTITTFSDSNKVLKGVSIGHKLTQYPKDAGTITSGLVKYEPAIIQPAKQILEAVGYYGISNIEFKYDTREGTYNLIEVNPRPGMWNYSSYKSGINLFEMLIKDIVLKEFIPYSEGRKPFLWTVLSKDKVLNEIKGTGNETIVRQLIRQGDYIDPRKNKAESMIYDLNVRILDVELKTRYFLKRLLGVKR
ncbi:ATP-grasp domain-containing protein [Sporomusa aerivorans]|uniref:carboxylate--amine ligase n=1 Tax=Sporomusa aerivorans TaxID=204936 RepID=UPI00352A04D9